jgi:small subunit ribosomal protein S7
MGDFDGEQKELIKKLVNFRMIDGKEREFVLLFIKLFTA